VRHSLQIQTRRQQNNSLQKQFHLFLSAHAVLREDSALLRENISRLFYVSITKYSYIRIWMLTRKMTQRNLFLRFDVVNLFSTLYCEYTEQFPWGDSQAKPYGGECAMHSTWNTKEEFYESSAKFLT
jgi:hypothetical protein